MNNVVLKYFKIVLKYDYKDKRFISACNCLKKRGYHWYSDNPFV